MFCGCGRFRFVVRAIYLSIYGTVVLVKSDETTFKRPILSTRKCKKILTVPKEGWFG